MKASANRNKRAMTALVVVAALAVMLIIWIGYIQLVKGEEYTAKVQSQMLGDNEIKASRGTIYDSNMNVIAQSASVWKVSINPKNFSEFDNNADSVREIVVSGLAGILGIDEEELREDAQKNKSYIVVKRGVEKSEKETLERFISDYAKSEKDENGNTVKKGINLNKVISIDPDVKRYYPYQSLASTVIGFTGDDGDGLAGIEAYYEDVLKGTSGRTLSAIDANFAAMPNQFETIYEAKQGNNLVLTLDVYIQSVLEKTLNEAMERTQAENIHGIVMDVDTGAILGMVSLPDYDLNNPFKIKSDSLSSLYEEAASAPEDPSESENDKYKKTKSYFLNVQWSNRAIISTYEPGSVFKVITTSAAVEEGVATPETSYNCGGVIHYATRNIKCWKAGGHGPEMFEDLLKNSCNPFTVTLADKLGTDTFYDYFEAFGFTEKTGIDSSGDFTPTVGSIYQSRSKFTQSDLASYSFGQSFQVSPLQMITAVSAVANGGNLMTPYLVKKVVDTEGNTVSETTPTVRRQVISESTAKLIRENMEKVVADGTGKPANVPGYHVAGKTGTSEKLTVKDSEAYVASFCGFAPANDPKIAVIVIVDEPKGAHGGSAVAAPLAGEVIEHTLEYLGIERSYSDEEKAEIAAQTPLLTGKTVAEAQTAAEEKNLKVEVIGDGDTVVSQYPDAGKTMYPGGRIVVYTDKEHTSTKVTVPDFNGCTVSEANRIAVEYGLNIKVSGVSLNSGAVYAYKQSVEAGTEVDEGEIITVSFKSTIDIVD